MFVLRLLIVSLILSCNSGEQSNEQPQPQLNPPPKNLDSITNEELKSALLKKMIDIGGNKPDNDVKITKLSDGIQIQFSDDKPFEDWILLVVELAQTTFDQLGSGNGTNTKKLNRAQSDLFIVNVFKDTPVEPPPPKPELKEDLSAAENLIKYVQNESPPTRKMEKSETVNWKPAEANLNSFKKDGDLAKIAVVDQIARNDYDTKIGFYHIANPGGAFANTAVSMVKFSYKGVEGYYAELFFQAEKVSRYHSGDLKNNFRKAFEALVDLKTKNSWPAFVKAVRALPMNFNTNEWDSDSVQIMSAIHAQRFKAEPDLFLSLVTTPFRSIVIEDAQGNDANWGNGAGGTGKNFLGLLYMTHRQRFWYAFKQAKNRNFDAKNAEDVSFMLKWLDSYDGTTK